MKREAYSERFLEFYSPVIKLLPDLHEKSLSLAAASAYLHIFSSPEGILPQHCLEQIPPLSKETYWLNKLNLVLLFSIILENVFNFWNIKEKTFCASLKLEVWSYMAFSASRMLLLLKHNTVLGRLIPKFKFQF